MMHYSTPRQVTLEKTPADYYRSENAPVLISQQMTHDVKIIIIMKASYLPLQFWQTQD